MAKEKIITLQKKFYLSGASKEIKTEKQYGLGEWAYQHVLTVDEVKREYDWNNRDAWFPIYNVKDIPHQMLFSWDWSGLRKLLPYCGREDNIPCVITTIFSSSDVERWDNSHQLKKDYDFIPGEYNFHASDIFYGKTIRYNETMLSRKTDSVSYEYDDGNIKWDVADRCDGATIYENSPLRVLMPESKEDYNGMPESFKIEIIVDANI